MGFHAMGKELLPKRPPIQNNLAEQCSNDPSPSVRSRMMARAEEMWQCQTVNCGYVYDPDRGDRKGKVPSGTRFEDLSNDWKCPICGASKKMFRPLRGPGSVTEERA